MALHTKTIDKEFLKRFMLQMILAHETRRGKMQPKSEIRQITPVSRLFLIQRRFPSPERPMQMQPQAQPILIEEIRPEKPEVKKYDMDLGRLNPFIKDSTISYIECPGANQRIMVKRGNVVSETDIILTKEEIENIIRKFSEKSDTPKSEVFVASFSSLTINAITSEFLGMRFIIQKMN